MTHHIPRVEERHAALLPGKYAGGAERNTDYMVMAAPAGVEVMYIEPDEAESAADGWFDRVVVGGTDKLSEASMNFLAAHRPIVWVQHAQHRTPAKAELFRQASRFLTMSRAHMGWEAEWRRGLDDTRTMISEEDLLIKVARMNDIQRRILKSYHFLILDLFLTTLGLSRVPDGG